MSKVDSTLCKKFGTSVVKDYQRSTKTSRVTLGDSLHLVKCDSDEVCVKTSAKKLKCTCNGFIRLSFCKHIYCLIFKKPHQFSNYVFETSIPCSKNVIGGRDTAGKKPNESCNRKGGRISKPRPAQAEASKVAGQYTIIRKSRRHTKCNGCKGLLQQSTSTYVLRHYCALPYKRDGMDRLSSPANHHFHLSRWCVQRSSAHKGFTGVVNVDPTVSISSNLRAECRTGNLVLQD